jgi:hypothetical protein
LRIRLTAACCSGIGTSSPPIADAVAERRLAAQEPPALALVALDLGDALARAVALGLGHGGQDGEDELGDTLPVVSPPRSIMRSPIPDCLSLPQHVERIEGGAEHAVQLGRDHHVAGLEDGQQRRALGPVAERFDADTLRSTNTLSSLRPCIWA